MKLLTKTPNTEYSIRANISQIDKKLGEISVPHDMDRKPRSLVYLKYWKGTVLVFHCPRQRVVPYVI